MKKKSQNVRAWSALAALAAAMMLAGCIKLWIQPIDATHSLNISAGVLYPKVFLGRSFNFLAIASNSSCE